MYRGDRNNQLKKQFQGDVVSFLFRIFNNGLQDAIRRETAFPSSKGMASFLEASTMQVGDQPAPNNRSEDTTS